MHMKAVLKTRALKSCTWYNRDNSYYYSDPSGFAPFCAAGSCLGIIPVSGLRPLIPWGAWGAMFARFMSSSLEGAMAKFGVAGAVLSLAGDSQLVRENGTNPAQDKPQTPRDIKKLKDLLGEKGIEKLKTPGGKGAGRYNLWKDREGNVYTKPQSGIGPWEETGFNLNNLQE